MKHGHFYSEAIGMFCLWFFRVCCVSACHIISCQYRSMVWNLGSAIDFGVRVGNIAIYWPFLLVISTISATSINISIINTRQKLNHVPFMELISVEHKEKRVERVSLPYPCNYTHVFFLSWFFSLIILFSSLDLLSFYLHWSQRLIISTLIHLKDPLCEQRQWGSLKSGWLIPPLAKPFLVYENWWCFN